MFYKNIAFLGIMSSIAAVLQISAGIFPGIGHILSIFSTLPIILAGRLGTKSGTAAYIIASFIILMIQPAETPIFLLMTGLIGLIIGFTEYKNYAILHRIIITSIVLTTGMILTVLIFRIPIFGGFTLDYSLIKRIIVYFLFSLPYSFFWVIFSRDIVNRVNKINNQ